MQRIVAMALGALLMLLPAAARAERPEVDVGGARGAVIVEAAGKQRIFEKDADKKLDVAGLVRLPALLYVCESMDQGIINGETVVTVSETAAHVGGSTAFLSAYEKAAAGTLLKAAVMITAGDAIYALAEACGGGLALGAINERMTALGVSVELSSIDGRGAEFSADDIARLGAALASTEAYRQYGGLYLDELTHENGGKTELVNQNRLIKTCDGCFAGSTGSSSGGGYSGVFAVKRGGSTFLCAVIGEASSKARFETAQRMIDAAFTSAKTIPCVQKGDVVASALVTGGMERAVDLIAAADAALLSFGEDKAQTVLNVPEQVAAPVKAGQVIGHVEYTTESGSAIAKVELLAAKDIPAAGWGDFVRHMLKAWVHA